MQRHEFTNNHRYRKLYVSTMSGKCHQRAERYFSRVMQICVSFVSVSLIYQHPVGIAVSVSHDVVGYNVSAMLPAENFTEWSASFQEAISIESLRTPGLNSNGLVLSAVSGVTPVIVYMCDAVKHNNISAMVVVGGQQLINTVLMATRHLGVPLLGYNTDRTSVDIRGERPLYLQLDPGRSLSAWAIVRILEKNQWFYASLITEEDYTEDGFVETFYALTDFKNKSIWRVEDHIRVSCKSNREQIDYQLLALLENQSRVIVLHASAMLSKVIFEVALQNGFVDGYAWFVTEDVIRGVPRTRCSTDKKQQPVLPSPKPNAMSVMDFSSYPAGLITVSASKGLRPSTLMNDVVRLVAEGLRRYASNKRPATTPSFSGSGCWDSKQRYFPEGDAFFRILKQTTVPTEYGQLSFDDDGVRTHADFEILNLVPDADTNIKQWKVIGRIKNDSLKFSTVLWPGNRISGPPAKGRRTLRVVTAVAEPFVMEQQAFNDTCTTSVSCLRVNTKDKEMLDDIFKDFESRIHNDSHPYNVSCCKGLSIMLLERLARDLEFHIQLYVTADEQFGHAEWSPADQSTRGQIMTEPRWTGLVGDLVNGAAHMAVSAFSITKSRSRVIDFTVPYFTAGFSIVVSEQKRRPPIYAFMEPFDGWVWISIVVSATVVAVALSLLEWNSPFGLNPWGRKRKTNYTLGSGLNMVYAILFQHTIKTKSPKAWPSKWLQNFWAGASIFIYSSYTANLAAFLAGKNSAVVITGVHDPQLLDSTTKSVLLRGTAVEDYTRQVNPRLLMKVQQYHPTTLPTETALAMLLNGTIDAYLDDTPIVEYIRTAIDAKCQLRLVGAGFGEDAYGIGLPKNSLLKAEVTQKILEYHESGFMEDLMDLFFRRTRCKDHSTDGQLQGEAASMNFDQHAGLYLLLLVGIFVCVLLMFVEHAVFKWIVSYWRRKPPKSFWKSQSMMFWSQRLHRIITSEELVSPHHSAREMIEVMKNRDFAKLFQKSVRKQEKMARNRKNLFNVVEQLKWKNRPGEEIVEIADSSAGVMKSTSVDVLTSSALVDSPIHLNAAIPWSASTDEVDRLRAVSIQLTPLRRGDKNSSLNADRDTHRQQSTSIPAYRRFRRALSSASSFDIEASQRSTADGIMCKPRRISRRSVEVAAQPMTSHRAVTSSPPRDSVDCRSHIWHSPTSRSAVAGGIRSTIGTSGSYRAADGNRGDSTSSGLCSVLPSRQDDAITDGSYRSAIACCSAVANDGEHYDVTDSPSVRAIASSVGQGRAMRDDIRRAGDNYRTRGHLTNGVVCDYALTSGLAAAPNGHEVIVDRTSIGSTSGMLINNIDDTFRYRPRCNAANRLHSFPSQPSTVFPDTRMSPPDVTTNFTKRRRRTVDLPDRDHHRSGHSASRVFAASDELDRIDLLEHITKEELFEMWQSSERALNEQLRAACQRRAEHHHHQQQQQQQQQQASPTTERITVT